VGDVVRLMTLYHEIFAEILKKITPTKTEINLIGNISETLKTLLDRRAEDLNIKYTVIEPQGSTGIKQTQLKNDFDIDLFIGLDYKEFEGKYRNLSRNKFKKTSKKDFLDLCNNWIIPSLTLKEFNNPRLLYAEHPYVTVDFYQEEFKIKIDIVLYFELDLEFVKEKGPITAVDRSPWHGRFVRENLSDDQKNDVRLLKQFFKANHSYGDKSSVGKVGFIGYSAELLIYYFGNILNLFENFDKLASNPLDFYKRSKKTLQEVTHFRNDYLLIIDPIDRNRNVASAISERAYTYCNYRIKEFLKNPHISFLEIKPISEIKIKNLKDPLLSKIFIIELKNLDEKMHYTINRDKLYSLGESIAANGEKEFTHAERFGTILFEIYFEDDDNEYNIVIYCKSPDITQTYLRKGPPIKESFHANNFKSKNPNHFEKNGHLWVETQREFTNFLEFLKSFIKKKIPENFKVLNISNCSTVKSSSGKKALTILTEMVLPFYL
jgi:tRNA nucleotidyltransferase (CCA-adding enzyme)